MVRSGINLDPRVECPLDSTKTAASLYIEATVATTVMTVGLRLKATTIAAFTVRSENPHLGGQYCDSRWSLY